MQLLEDYWQGILGTALLILLLVAYRYFVRKAQAYTDKVKQELEGYVRATPSAMMPPQLHMPARNHAD